MALLGRRRRRAPRLAPELDDPALGRVLRGIAVSRGSGPQDIAVAQLEQLLRTTGDDWDRRCHRVSVLAEAAPALARGWRLRRPRDPDALILHAWADLAVARATGVLDDPRATLETCRLAAEACPADPTPWVARLALLRLLGRPSRELTPVWREITARDPWHREAHLQILGHLSPEERGSQSSVREFVDDVVAAMPPGAPAACLPLAAAVRQFHRDLAAGGTRALGMSRYWAQPHVAPLIDDALEHWPRPGFLTHAATVADLNLLAHALVRAGRTADAAPVLRATGELVTEWPWNHDGDPVERYTYWYGRLSG
ncbi:hypothetical protein [Streptomyces sp. GC420]|uniref:hypothetical protein n=1 Tax=Streptomyces sp. GC420 TaxID=2697568 RepID=UPI001414E186|nr:hypothetical protein [Streptomyces sp. GC420]NBM16951.1 hypothetical protein [Streptomyces sp. GC420]